MVANRVKSHRNREQWGIHWIRCKFPYLGCYTFTILCIWELFLCVWELFPFKQIYLNVEIMLPSLGCCGSYIFLGILLELSVHSFQCLLCIINKQLCRKLLLFVVFHKLHMWARLCASRSAPPRLQLAPSGPCDACMVACSLGRGSCSLMCLPGRVGSSVTCAPLVSPLGWPDPGSAAHGRDYPAGGIPHHLRTLRAVCAHVRVACACGLMMSRILRRRWRQMSGLRLDGRRGSHTRPANGGHSLPLHTGVKGRKKRYLLLISVLIKDTI